MGIKGGKNPWWNDVLENGPFSEYASFFEIQWNPDKRELQDKVLLPVLEDSYGMVLENQQIKLHFQEGHLFVKYADFHIPLSLLSYAIFLEHGWEEFIKQHPVSKQVRAEFEKSDRYLQKYHCQFTRAQTKEKASTCPITPN